jgi:hypothetical protein
MQDVRQLRLSQTRVSSVGGFTQQRPTNCIANAERADIDRTFGRPVCGRTRLDEFGGLSYEISVFFHTLDRNLAVCEFHRRINRLPISP